MNRNGPIPSGATASENAKGEWVPLYEGKMIWHFDHRAASVVINPENQYRPAFPKPTEPAEHSNPAFTPVPQFWILVTEQHDLDRYALAFRDVTTQRIVALWMHASFLIGTPETRCHLF
jgi:hypothetical protein